MPWRDFRGNTVQDYSLFDLPTAKPAKPAKPWYVRHHDAFIFGWLGLEIAILFLAGYLFGGSNAGH